MSNVKGVASDTNQPTRVRDRVLVERNRRMDGAAALGTARAPVQPQTRASVALSDAQHRIANEQV